MLKNMDVFQYLPWISHLKPTDEVRLGIHCLLFLMFCLVFFPPHTNYNIKSFNVSQFVFGETIFSILVISAKHRFLCLKINNMTTTTPVETLWLHSQILLFQMVILHTFLMQAKNISVQLLNAFIWI